MTYVINLGKELGTNTYDFIHIKSFESINDYMKAKVSLEKDLKRMGLTVKTSVHNDGEFVMCYIIIKGA